MKDTSALTSETEGIIDKVIRQKATDEHDAKIIVCELRISFEVNGKKYKTSMRLTDDENSYQEGQSVTVLYDEAKPRHAMVKGDENPQRLWQMYPIAAFILFVLAVTILVITLPDTLHFTKDGSELFKACRNAVFCLICLAFIIFYRRSKEFKKAREEGRKPYKDIAFAIVIMAKAAFDVVWYILVKFVF